MYYRHDLNYEYPERSDEHMIDVKHIADVKLDTEYPYFPKGFKFGFIRTVYWCAVNAIVFTLL